MQAEICTHQDQAVTEFVARINGAGDGPAARDAYRDGFKRLRSQLEMYPVAGRHPSVAFESAAKTARTLGSDIQPLKKTTSAMKLRVSLMAQSTMVSLRDREYLAPIDAKQLAQQLRADASELCYIKSQPTADEIILRSIGVPQLPCSMER